MSRLGDLGEAGFIARLRQRVRGGADVLAGIGDDCAVLRAGDQTLLFTCDAALEGVHFDLGLASAYDAGWRCAAGAISDIAAMGGRPRFVTLAIGAPATTPLELLDELLEGIQGVLAHTGAALVGGDTIASPLGIFLDFSVIGLPLADRVLLRSGARPGDCLAVTGWPGRSAAGLHALRQGLAAPDLIQAHLHPLPRIAEGQWLATQPGVRAMTDVSDGLLRDAGHLAEASGLGLDLESSRLPMDPVLRAFAQAANRDAAAWMQHGGEDYELALAIAPDGAEAVCAAFRNRFDLPLHLIGTFGTSPGLRLDGQPATRTGYDHFAADT
jgi:thiamine-monophosphate kinase